MADQTIQPAAVTSPDPTQGGTAVTTPAATGHATTNSTASGVGNTTTKTCIWSSFPAPSIRPPIAVLLVDWTQNGSLEDGGVDTGNIFLIDYTTDGGSVWNSLHADSQIQAPTSGTDQVSLGSIDISLLQVRDSIQAIGASDSGDVPLQASLTARAFNIRLEVTYGANRIMMGMM